MDGQKSVATRVENVLAEGSAAACSINLGEVLYTQIRAVGPASAREVISTLRQDMEVIDPDWELVATAAAVKAGGGLSYADAFCIATAERLGAPLWTGDPEIVDRMKDLPCAVEDLRA